MIEWPRNTLVPRHCEVNPAYRTVSGGVALNGYERVVASDAGVWVVTYAEFPIPDANRILLWRTMSTRMNGRLNSCAIPIYEEKRAPYPAVGTTGYPAETLSITVPHSDLSPFSDTSLYESSGILVYVSSNAALRAVQLTVSKPLCGTIVPGHRFSINHRLYQVDDVISQTNTSATLKIWPPLRQAVVASEFCNFVSPTLKARLMSDQEMDESLDYNRWGFPTVKFIEDTL